MPDDAPAEPRGFSFLYRTDRGVVDRATWWRGTVPLAVIGLLATGGWLLVRPYTHEAISQPPALAVLGYLYLLAFTFATLILFICGYNLSAKRFTARGLPRALASLLPLSFLGTGALDWYLPRSQGLVPGWTIWLAIAVVVGLIAWFVIELGLRADAPATPR